MLKLTPKSQLGLITALTLALLLTPATQYPFGPSPHSDPNSPLGALISKLTKQNTGRDTRPPLRVPPVQCSLDLIKNWVPSDYPFKAYQVTTDDGYILNLFRLQAKGTQFVEGKPAVFFQHGLNDDGNYWLLNAEQSPGFMFANAGFDVWLGNNRGCKYSRKHVKYSVLSKEFWEFSFDEMGKYDLTANLKFISEVRFAFWWGLGGFLGSKN